MNKERKKQAELKAEREKQKETIIIAKEKLIQKLEALKEAMKAPDRDREVDQRFINKYEDQIQIYTMKLEEADLEDEEENKEPGEQEVIYAPLIQTVSKKIIETFKLEEQDSEVFRRFR